MKKKKSSSRLSSLQYQEKHTNIEEKLTIFQTELDDAKNELNRVRRLVRSVMTFHRHGWRFFFVKARQREKMSEDHNVRLTQTIDKLLNESNERLQANLKERMQVLDEKNSLTQECERLCKLIEDLESDKSKLYADIDRLKVDLEASKKEQNILQQKLK